MANDERIDSLVDDRAFKQIEKLISELDRAQKEFAEAARQANAFTAAIGKSRSVTELTEATKKAEQEVVKLSSAEEKATKSANRAAEAENKLVQATKQRLLSGEEENRMLNKITGTLDDNIRTEVRLRNELKRVKDEQKRLNKETRGLSISREKYDRTSENLLRTERELKVALQQNSVAVKQSIREAQAANGSYNEMTNRLLRLRQAWRELTAAERENTAAGRQLETQINELDREIKQLDARMGVHNRNVGNYKSALQGAVPVFRNFLAAFGVHNRNVGNYKSALQGAVPVFRNFLAAFGVIGGIQIFANVMRSAGRTVAEFQTAQATLAGVMNTTRSEIGRITDQAKQLGSTTAATAVDVAKLQTELARLGFAEQEIIDLTPAVITGAIALQAEFSDVALTVGAVVKTFDTLSSANAPEIIDQMTAAANLSAISFKTLQTAIPIVSGAANAAGISFTRLLALLGKLSDAGIDASMSATALRNIFIESASQGLNYEQILEKISSSTDKLTASTDQFGKRAAVSGTILSGQLDTLDEFEQKLSDAGGTAQRLADEQLSTLNGALTLLKSAWAGLILEIESGEGVISKVITAIVNAITVALNAFAQLGNFIAVFPSVVIDSFNVLFNAIKGIKINLINPAETVTSFNLAMERVKKGVINNIRNLRQAMNLEAEGEPFNIIVPEAIIDPNATVNLPTEDGGGGDGGKGIKARKRLLQITTNLNRGISESTINTLREEVAARTKLGGDAVKIARENNKKLKEAHDQQLAKALENIKRREEAQRAAFDLSQELAGLGFDLFQNSITRDENKLRQELDMIERRKQAEIDAANASAESEEKKAARIQIAEARAQAAREQVERRQRQLDLKRAQFEKAQAVASIIANTARAVVAALPNIPLSVIIGAIGAVQLARALAAPIPQFYKGTESAPGGLAWVGERGTEAVVTPRGETFLTPNGPTLANLEKGSKVITNQKLRNYMISNSTPVINPAGQNVNLSELVTAQRNGTTKIVKALTGRPEKITTLTARGLRTAYRKGNSWRRYLNRNL